MFKIKPKLRNDLRIGKDFDKNKIIIKDPLLQGNDHPGYLIPKITYLIMNCFTGLMDVIDIKYELSKKHNVNNIKDKDIEKVHIMAKKLLLLEDATYIRVKQKEEKKLRQLFFSGANDSLFPSKKKEHLDLLNHQYKKAILHYTNNRLKGVILPHIPAYASGRMLFNALIPLVKNGYKKFVIIGPNHLFHKTQVFLCNKEIVSPLGSIKQDFQTVSTLSTENYFTIDNLLHKNEHSIQVILPYLQYLVGKELEIIPLLVSNVKEQNKLSTKTPLLDEIVETLCKYIDVRDVGIIISGDLTHYMGIPMYDPINKSRVCLFNRISETIKEWDDFIFNSLYSGNIDDVYDLNGKITYCLLDSLYLGWKLFGIENCKQFEYFQTEGIERKTVGTSIATLGLYN